ncbi:MAG: hypothetical protein LLG13_06825 [Bacteroidales bacterium]|nr:hypothetical protein [Bacteroidales bacterium]
MKYRVIFLYTVLLISGQLAFGQYYETGQDPSSIKWKQIKTARFRVIYPERYDSGGISFAKSLDEAYSKIVSIYPGKRFKIPVIIHNYTVRSNGYVAWAPRRIELYPTPEQNAIPLDPEKQLAIHELTHVFQMESLNKKFSGAMEMIFGEQFPGVIASLLPLWFFEGDAVFAESVLTESGRGRTPSFQKQLKAISVENGSMYNYDKIVNGSYKDFVPDHYETGYQMVTWARAKYDPQIWNKVLKYTSEQPFTINPVNISLSRNTGLRKKTLFKETFDSLKTIWINDISSNNALSYEEVNPEKNGNYINYYSPVFAGTDSIIAIKTSLKYPPEFVLINPTEKSEKRIHVPGLISPYVISGARNKIVWVETEPDPRWENRNYSVIKIMDIKSKRINRLSRKSRYLSASLSPDGRTIAATCNTINNVNNLVFIDAENGTVIKSEPAPGNVYLQRPLWADDGKKITFVFLAKAGEGIISYSLAGNEWNTLVETGDEDLKISYLRNDSLFFISSMSGTDNIYLRTPDKKILGLTRSRFGVNDLSVSGNNVYFSDYSSAGNCISSTKIQDIELAGDVSQYRDSASFLINRFNISPVLPKKTGKTEYTPEPYRKWLHLFRLHSWMPFYADIEEIKEDPANIRPGISLMSQNHLSTLISSIGYEYSSEKHHVFHSRIIWNGWYPVLESNLDYGTRPIIYKTGSNTTDPAEIQQRVVLSNIVSLPLSFSFGRFSQYLRPSFTWAYRNDYVYIKEENIYDHGQSMLSGRVFFSNHYKYALRDIYPRWGQVIDLNYSFAPFDKKIYGSEISMMTSFYFPGFLPNNGIKISYEKEKQDPVKFWQENKISLPRGYKNILSEDIDLFSVDYVLPLAYPDFNIASLLYLKRIRGGVFYDYASGTGNLYLKDTGNTYHDYEETFESFGGRLMADFHIFRMPFLISGGVQSAWRKIGNAPSLEFLFNIDLFGMTIGRSPM